jgi:hypothetical protein
MEVPSALLSRYSDWVTDWGSIPGRGSVQTGSLGFTKASYKIAMEGGGLFPH